MNSLDPTAPRFPRALGLALALSLGVAAHAESVVHFGEDLEVIDPAQVAIERKLAAQRVSLEFEETGIVEVFAFIRQLSGINIVIDPGVLESRSEDELQVTLDIKDVTLENAIKLILELKDLERSYKHGVMIVAAPESVKKDMFFKVYDVRDLMFELQDFPGPNIELVEDESDGGFGIHVDDSESSNPFADEDTLTELIETNVSPESWEQELANLSLRNGILIVTNTRDVHIELRRFLDELRSMR